MKRFIQSHAIVIAVFAIPTAVILAAFIPSTIENLNETRAAAKAEQARQAEQARRAALMETSRREHAKQAAQAQRIENVANALAAAYVVGVIDGYKADGLADWRGDQYFINPLLWVMMPGPGKINCIEYMSIHHRSKGGSGSITLRDAASGAKLGSHSLWSGATLD